MKVVRDLKGIGEGLGEMGKELVDLFGGVDGLVVGIKDGVGVVEVFWCSERDKGVVGLGILVVEKVEVVGR